MSRRKPKLAELPAPEYSRNQSVRVICTDHGQHEPELLFHLSDRQIFTGPGDLKRPPEEQRCRRQAVGWSRDVTWPEERRRETPVAEWTPSDGSRTYRFNCPACPRNVLVREDRFFRVLDALSSQRHGDVHPELDIWLLG